MSLRIRLRRIGRKKQPSYRVVVTNSAAPRDGAYVDEVGFYNPRRQPAELRLDLEKVETWLGKGATLSTTAASLLRKAKKGGDAKVGYQSAAEVAEAAAAPAVAAAPAAKRAPRKAAAAGSRGTPAEPVEAAAEAPAQADAVAPEAEAEAPAVPAEEPAAE